MVPKTNIEQLLAMVMDNSESVEELYRQSCLEALVPKDFESNVLRLRPYDPEDQPKYLLAYSSQIKKYFEYSHFVVDNYYLFHLLRSVLASKGDSKALLDADIDALQKLVDLLVRLNSDLFFLPFDALISLAKF